VILGVAGGAAALLWFTVAAGHPSQGSAPRQDTLFGTWRILYDYQAPMDADTALDDGFPESAVSRFTSDRALMAIGVLFDGEEGDGLPGQFQRNEYIRYAREMHRRRGRVFVLTGTASRFRPVALRSVAESRSTTLPGVHGDVYDTAALTEDNELTIAL
jgi:cellulose synthase/poly-beta-1,6-N-acetylglucosamine synthase-like glycosyltransferase